MLIIGIEGLDKSGKHTQSKLLTEYLQSKGYRVVQSEFHRYDTPTGQLIQKWLYNEWDVDKHTIELLMSADKQAQQLWFKKLDESGVDFLILDRYTASQTCYANATGVDRDWTKQLQKYMRLPDFEIFIDIEPNESIRRKGKHGDNDRYERDKELLKAVRKEYLDYFNKLSSKLIIHDCSMYSVEQISKIIIESVDKFITDVDNR